MAGAVDNKLPLYADVSAILVADNINVSMIELLLQKKLEVLSKWWLTKECLYIQGKLSLLS